MQSKTTFNKIRRAFKTAAIAVGFLSLFTGLANAQTYVNGPLSTGATSSNGTAAPTGYTWSEVQLGNTNAGFGANITANLTVADNFTVPAGPSWNITTAKFYAYSTGYAGTTSPFVDVRLQIFNTDPSVGSPTPIFGNLTTNRFASSTNANMYRIFNATPGTTRIIWEITANIGTTLAPGNYWIEWQLGNGGISNFSPSVTVAGQVTQPGNNGKQHDLAAGTWITLVDGANVQDMPFKLDYTTGACSGTPTPGNTITSSATVCPSTPFNLSLQNTTSGSGVTYQWFSGPSATGPWTPIAGATSSTHTVANLPATTFYQATVTCSGNTGTSAAVQVALNPPSACYCIPGTSDCTDGDVIENVTMGALNNSSSCSTNGYANYTTDPNVVVPDVIIGAANPISVSVPTPFLLPERVAAWIDYNRNGQFEASEFTFIGSTAVAATLTANINVPSSVTPGITRMRVRCRWNTAIAGTDACTVFAFGETEDYNVNLVPCTPATITTQPANATVVCGANATFTVAVAGSLPSVYWEYRTSATGVWLNVPNAAPYTGVNTSTLTIGPANAGLNGYQYRAVYQGACTGVDFSNAATLTVSPLNVTITPTAATVCSVNATPVLLTVPNTTATASFTNSTAGVITDGAVAGITRTFNVTGITGSIQSASIRLNITHPYVSDVIAVLKAPNGQVLNIKYGINSGVTLTLPAGANLVNTVFSSTATAGLQTGTAPGWTGTFKPDGQMVSLFAGTTEIKTGPTGFIATTPNFADLFTVANGTWTLAMYDWGTPDEGTFNNATLDFVYGSAPATATFSPTTGLFTDVVGTVAYTGTAVTQVYAAPTATTTYTATISTAVCTKTQTIVVTANTPISGTSTTANAATCVGGNTSFTATIPTGSGILHQWKVSTNNGATYANVVNGGVYSGATTATLNITGATSAMNGYMYKDSLYVPTCNSFVFTNAATLTVNPLPVLNLTASPFTEIYPGQTTTLAVASTTTVPANGYTWYRNGVVIPGANGNTLVVDVDGLGTYTVEVSDANGCGNAVPASITIGSAANDIMFIYPSPNNGQFQVRYYSDLGPTVYPRLLNIYDSKGARVYSKSYSITSPYTRLDVDATRLPKGIYSVELIDFNGNRIKTGRVLIN